ncbi:MAG: hypothetical protein AB1483_00445 [Candidatus Zixiibacteriota bacterium]
MNTKKAKITPRGDLAEEIAKTFQEQHRVELYRYIVEKHDEGIVRKAFEEVIKMPPEKIKKSRSALFFFLLNKYAEK